MRFTALFAVASATISAVSASTLDFSSISLQSLLGGIDVSSGNKYGAPKAPWIAGSTPGWYFGSSPSKFKTLPCLSGIICAILELFPDCLHCPSAPPTTPSPSDGYAQTFSNLTGATQASDYMTYGLVDTVAQCKAMCNSVNGCNFVNTYHDVNGKGGSTQLTCSLFTSCHTSADADNMGGQTQPDGTVDYITNSDGWCKQ
ncbi:hypothetical protein K443DRAFT_671425 [Laccaria amethystina LaAM-08-1]|uniref:Apple domain-containing protein n=1 Tax=Laccaria amethystina LaAM-08-1 TaxID=1095629 RepID=A0A0C9Y6C3_9AGAR|nr:hypothetical protein K443DRAFT_671425 [Laccaria amethystina LaAM-08-1]